MTTLLGLIAGLYYFLGIWQWGLGFVEGLVGSFPGGQVFFWFFLILLSCLVIILSGFLAAAVFKVRLFGLSYWTSWLAVGLLFLPVLCFTLGPGKYCCSTATECARANYDCCPSCQEEVTTVNIHYRDFRRRLNLCFLRDDCFRRFSCSVTVVGRRVKPTCQNWRCQ